MRNHNLFVKKLVTGAALGAVALTAGLTARPAQATPSTLGFYPSTDIYGPGTFHLDVDTYGRGLRGDVSVTSGITYGIGDSDKAFGRTEIGLDYAFSAGGGQPLSLTTGTRLDGTKRLTFNAKTQLFNNADSGTRVVAGVWGLGSKEFGAPNVAYLEGSKTFGFGRVHLGVANNFAGKIGGARVTNVGTDNDKFAVTAAYDRYLSSKVQFVVDYYSGKNSYSGVQPTFYFFPNDKCDFGIGLFRANSKNVNPRNQVYFCFDYNFDLKGSTPAPAPAPAAATPAP